MVSPASTGTGRSWPSRVICMGLARGVRMVTIVWPPNKLNGLNPSFLPDLLGYRLRLAQQALFRDFADRVGELSPGRVGILMLIEANPGVTQSRLAKAVSLDR